MGEKEKNNSKVKFLCSYGGKILPRPSKGQLKYVGGTTRVIAVPRDITFAELKKKLGGMVDGGSVLKYQLIPEEFDTLVSVNCDEDLHYMLEEHDRRSRLSSAGGSAQLRTFLFPSTPLTLSGIGGDYAADPLERRYIDAINGIVRNHSSSSLFTISSPGSSPKSIAPETAFNGDPESLLCSGMVGCNHGGYFLQPAVHKVQSLPNLVCEGTRQQTSYQRYHGRRIPPVMPAGADAVRFQMGHAAARRFYTPVEPCRMSGWCPVCGHVNGFGECRGVGLGNGDGLPHSTMMKQRWGSPRSPLRGR